MQKGHLEVFWDGKTWRVKGSVLGKRIRKSLRIREESQKKLAERAAELLFKEEYLKGVEREKVKFSPLFSTTAMNYMKARGYNRYVDYADKALQIIGPDMRNAELEESTLYQLGVEHLPTYSRQSVKDCFVKPVMTMIRHENGEWKERTFRKKPRVRVLTVGQMLRLLHTAENDPRVLRWDPHRWTFRKMVFQLGGITSPGETCAVLAADIDTQHKRVTIAGREPGGQKNDYRLRDVYLPDFHWDRLGELPTEGKAFLSPRGEPYEVRKYRGGQYREAFKSVLECAGLPPEFTPNDLRHTAASHFYAATRNIKALERQGGWAGPDIPLSTYVELLPVTTADELLAASIDYGQVLDRMGWRGA